MNTQEKVQGKVVFEGESSHGEKVSLRLYDDGRIDCEFAGISLASSIYELARTSIRVSEFRGKFGQL